MRTAFALMIALVPTVLFAQSPVPPADNPASSLEGARAQIQRCWLAPADNPVPDVVVSVRYKRDGTLDGEPKLVSPGSDARYQRAAAAVIRALKACQPLRLPAEKYRDWKYFEISFVPVVAPAQK